MHTRLLPVLGYCLDKIWGMFRPPFAPQSHNAGLTLIGIAVMTFAAIPANASILWDWNYSGSGITASGTFTTGDTPDANGAYLITDITGTRNSETITALQPPGTSIPGTSLSLLTILFFPAPGHS
jgi:hypothetical protein